MLSPGQRYTFFQRSYFDATNLTDNESGNFMPIVQTQSVDTKDDDLDGMYFFPDTQPALTCFKLTIETLGGSVKYVQS